MYNKSNQELSERWINHFSKVIHNQSPLTNDVELYLALPEDNSGPVEYYFVDHKALTQFWADNESVPALSNDSLAQARYWRHIERFPTHLPATPPQLIKALIVRLKNGSVRTYHWYSSRAKYR